MTSRGGTGLSPAGWEDGAVENTRAGEAHGSGEPEDVEMGGGYERR